MEEINGILKRIRVGDLKVAKSAQFISSDLEKRRRREAGSLYDAMASNRDFAVRLLGHRDCSVRKAALSMFINHWAPDTLVEEICERLAYAGPRDLRLRAITVLSFIRNHLYGERVSTTLARFALDPAIEWELRADVYFLLRCSFGTMEQRLAMLSTPEAETKEGGEIDPHIIQQCVDAEEATSQPKLKDYQLESMRLYQEGKRLFHASDYAQAEVVLSKALTVWPGTAGPLLIRARVREALGRLDEAIEDCSVAVSVAPHVASFYRYRAGLYRRLGQTALAQADISRADLLERPLQGG